MNPMHKTMWTKLWGVIGSGTLFVLLAAPALLCAQISVTNLAEMRAQIPKSEFDDSLPNGRDPFFPRFQTAPIAAPTNVVRTASSLLVVKGMSWRANKRLVIIGSALEPGKSWSLEAGDEREIVLGNSRVKLKCDEIRDDVVVVSLGTPPQKIELPVPKSF
ncbi:MAG: hypothetical protein NZ739_07200 [Verrucomicrobiae bacterium]|nr:hypothetical protein [Verrucomicrobiae bacterium]MCX7723155.1 hypothetical protein [Verrucomicrobiae bacterium]MDW7979857.1 hypothetical protein [Verrucomicrobiales bacterium]